MAQSPIGDFCGDEAKGGLQGLWGAPIEAGRERKARDDERQVLGEAEAQAVARLAPRGRDAARADREVLPRYVPETSHARQSR